RKSSRNPPCARGKFQGGRSGLPAACAAGACAAARRRPVTANVSRATDTNLFHMRAIVASSKLAGGTDRGVRPTRRQPMQRVLAFLVVIAAAAAPIAAQRKGGPTRG